MMVFRQALMANRPTIHDVAREAGVSSATVDRVLNGREKVRQETARKVYEAARLIGYHAAPLIGQRVHADLPRLRLGIVLHKERQAFYQQFHAEAERAVTQAIGVRASLQVAFAASQSPKDFTELMEGMASRVDAVAATAVTHPEVTEAVIRLNAKGIPCFSLLNDFAQGVRQNYIGLNNLKVGRIAAHMIATASHQSGKIAVFVGGYRWHGHELRETGVRSYFREHAPQFQILDTRSLPKYHDEAGYPGLDALRIATLRTWDSEEGTYITNAPVLSPSGSDYVYVQHVRTINRGCEIAFQILARALSRGVAKNPKPGPNGERYIAEGAALRIEAAVNVAMRSELAGQVDDIEFTMSRTDDISSNQGAIGTGKVESVSLAYFKHFAVTAGFVKSISQ